MFLVQKQEATYVVVEFLFYTLYPSITSKYFDKNTKKPKNTFIAAFLVGSDISAFFRNFLNNATVLHYCTFVTRFYLEVADNLSVSLHQL